jgi:hypothetical protein
MADGTSLDVKQTVGPVGRLVRVAVGVAAVTVSWHTAAALLMVPLGTKLFPGMWGGVIFLALAFPVWLVAVAVVLAALRVKRGWAVWLMGSAISAVYWLEAGLLLAGSLQSSAVVVVIGTLVNSMALTLVLAISAIATDSRFEPRTLLRVLVAFVVLAALIGATVVLLARV